MFSTLLITSALASLSTAHFTLQYPAARGFDEDILGTFPCGGQDTVSSTRTPWPLAGGEISLDMGHVSANVEVLLGMGNDPGSAFNTVIRPTFRETGPGNFCFDIASLPEGLNVTEGMNATIQVVTNGDPDGGLYNCADITFSNSAPAPGSCTNRTGVTASTDTVSMHANGTALSGSSTDSSPSGSSTSAAATPSASGSDAVKALQAGLGGLIVAGGAALAIIL